MRPGIAQLASIALSTVALASLARSGHAQQPPTESQPAESQPAESKPSPTTPAPQGDGATKPDDDSTVAYPTRDILSPFRSPQDIYAPRDELFRQLGIMQRIAQRPTAPKRVVDGREEVDNEAWARARAEVDRIGMTAGELAAIMRSNRDGQQRSTAFYGMFYVTDVGMVIELIAHIPGEPLRHIREAALPRAIDFMREHLSATFGDLTAEQKQQALRALPEVGSPAAKSQGVHRLPDDKDHLYDLRMVPFFQLIDRDDPLDQAQGLWFLKETFQIRPDYVNLWLEPALPRLRELLMSEDPAVRSEAEGIFLHMAPEGAGELPDVSQREERLAWAKRVAREQFPAIRNLNDSIVQIYPGEERDQIAAELRGALGNSRIGDPFRGQREDGGWFTGFRVALVPEALAPLAIPQGAIVTAVNGVGITSAQQLLQVIEKAAVPPFPRRLFVDYMLDGKPHAVEYRLM